MRRRLRHVLGNLQGHGMGEQHAMKWLAFMLLAGCSAASAGQRIYVHDGDTLTVDGTKWRLWGVDAPELAQECVVAGEMTSCGRDSWAHLDDLVFGKHIDCEPRGKSYDRMVGLCTVDDGADGVDLGSEMVRAGWALDYPRFSHGAYAALEAAAKAETRGVWSGRFQMPWEYRQEHRPR